MQPESTIETKVSCHFELTQSSGAEGGHVFGEADALGIGDDGAGGAITHQHQVPATRRNVHLLHVGARSDVDHIPLVAMMGCIVNSRLHRLVISTTILRHFHIVRLARHQVSALLRIHPGRVTFTHNIFVRVGSFCISTGRGQNLKYSNNSGIQNFRTSNENNMLIFEDGNSYVNSLRKFCRTKRSGCLSKISVNKFSKQQLLEVQEFYVQLFS